MASTRAPTSWAAKCTTIPASTSRDFLGPLSISHNTNRNRRCDRDCLDVARARDHRSPTLAPATVKTGMANAMNISDDATGAFCRHNHVAMEGRPDGQLGGLDFGAKDIFDIAGTTSSFGNPVWFETHEPATATAPAVRRLLDAGASMAGRTISDELAYSLTGENIHYGTPVNPRDPNRIPGGSSCGSASAVAAGRVDFALGTDCGGSVRLPASYCGLLGIRPSLGRISTEGVLPFSASFDVIGWFARDAGILADVGEVLFDNPREAHAPDRLIIANDAFGFVDPAIKQALLPAVSQVSGHFQRQEENPICHENLEDWFTVFRTIQASEIWANHGAWIERHNPKFGPGIDERMEWASQVTPAQVRTARARHLEIVNRINNVIGESDVLCMPTSPRIAPFRNQDVDTIEVTYRHQAMGLLCVSGLGGLPQISLPMTEVDGMPLGLSLIARSGNDEMLLELAKSIMTN
jgi:amidase